MINKRARIYFKTFLTRLAVGVLVWFMLGITATAQQKFTLDNSTGKPVQTLKHQTLNYDYGICGYLHRLLPQSKGLLTGDITIESCIFRENPKTVSDELRECPAINLKLPAGKRLCFYRNLFTQPLVLGGMSGAFVVGGNSMPYIFLNHLTSSEFTVVANRVPQVIHLSQVHGDRLDINNNVFSKDTAQVVVMNSNLQQSFIDENIAKVINLKFHTDTLGTVIWQNQTFDKKYSAHQIGEVLFAYCSLQGDIWPQAVASAGKRSYRFYSCDFGRGARLLGLNADTIEFRDCLTFAKGVTLDCDRAKQPIILKIIHSDLTNLDLDYDDRFRLYHWNDPDITRSNFENLLVKFQNEKKLGSYQQLDIEYFKFRHGFFVNTVALIWWNYSYDKWLIIYWTIGFLLLFTIINFFSWNKLHATYPIVKTDDLDGGGKLVKIFVFTALIFFSLRIDFNKLSFKHAGWLSYFFLQYMLGLLCLFFIANTIFKLG